MRRGSGRTGRTERDEGCKFQQATDADNRLGDCDQRYGIAVRVTVSKGRCALVELNGTVSKRVLERVFVEKDTERVETLARWSRS